MTYQTRVWIQRFTLVSMVLPLLVALGFVSAMLFMDFNQYKPQLVKLISDKTGYQARIDGDLKVGLLPFSLTLHEVGIKNPAGFHAPDLAAIEAVQVQLSLWALFVDKTLRLQGVELEGAHLNLEMLVDGKSNWQGIKSLSFLTDDAAKQQKVSLGLEPLAEGLRYAAVADQEVPLAAPAPSPEQSLINFWMFDSLTLHNSQVLFQVYEAGLPEPKQMVLSNIDLMAFDVAPNKPFQSSLSMTLHSSDLPQTWHLEGLTTLNVDASLKTWQFNNWNARIRLNLPAEMQVPEMHLTSEGEALRLDFAQQRWVLQKGLMTMSPAKVALDMQGRWGLEGFYEGHLKAENFNVPKWLRHIGLPSLNFVNDKALTQVAGEFDFKANAEESSLRNLALTVDGATLVGQVWQNQDASKTSKTLGFDLDINDLDMDIYQVRHIQAAKEGADKSAASNAQSNAKDDKALPSAAQSTEVLNATYLPLALPIETLRSLNAQGQLTLGKLKIWQHRFEAVDIHVSAKEGQLALAPLDAQMYQGQLQSKLQLDVSGKTPAYVWQGKMKGLDLSAFLQEGWQNAQVSGVYDGYFDLRTQGVNAQLLRQNMNGQFSAYVKQGAVKGIDLNKLLSGQTSGAKDATAFKELVVDGKIKNGIYGLQKLTLISDRFKGSGFGQVDLVSGAVKAQVNGLVITPPPSLPNLAGMEVPIQLQGPLAKVRWSVDLKGLLNHPGNQERLLKEVSRLFES
ncbi:AsmA family protein [Thiosulfativibrio zosterae]|uniref:Cell envelope biogenesis protein AsmA n=1 Tax=Thiosulfativibrio zosterae TaxID=2675053 RepID=A0A6F8PJV4_9GAMM|nr:AsmA family protein [Thiosulfativibrio zosterae]BBP42383.1 cell envelope biogenesis protein AsmA [Thiosulfativibrio zosterae]